MRALHESNLCYPVLIEINDGSGSGFYFRTDTKIFLVTALHVLYGDDKTSKVIRGNSAKITSYDKDLTNTIPIEYALDLSQLNIRKNDVKDIVLVELGSINTSNHNIAFERGVTRISSTSATITVAPSNLLKKFNDVLVSNDVYILGYPSSLSNPIFSQIEIKRPLLRKGIIAGKNLSNETIILDCPVYFGNSGGLAIEVEEVSNRKQYRIIGVVSQYIPFVEELHSQLGYTNLNYENSGYSVVVPIDTILSLTTEDPE